MPKIRRLKRPDAASNARPRKIAITGHGATSRTLSHASFDLRSRIGRAYRAHCVALTAHLGGNPSIPQQSLIDHAARLRLMAQLAWAELQRAGAFRNGETRPAFDAYRRAAADEREVLRLLGLERREVPVPSLEEYLDGQETPDA